ncbi:MAG: porin [Elusimicrobia bacterium]|nr:porin [Elusimicrobiota bacterium]
MKPRIAALLSLFVALAPAAPVLAQDGAKLGELERKVDVLTQEIEKIKLGESAEAPAEKSVSGFAPASSKVYFAKSSKVSLGGYGEFTVTAPSKRKQNGDPSGLKKQADLRRVVVYVGYKFNDRFLFNSEIEFEHAGSGEGGEVRGEVAVEQAYLDYKAHENIGVRAGLVIVPLGLVNEVHEPTAFHGVNRPSVEQWIIPSTWRENGAGVFGDIGPVSYRSYVMAGLHGKNTADPKTDGFTGLKAIRGGRTEGTNTSIEDLAWASRVDVSPVQGVKAGAGLYIGQADQGDLTASVPLTLWETHATAEYRGASLKALYAAGSIGNADSLSLAQGAAAGPAADAATVGSRFFGGYAEAAYDVMTLVRNTKGQALSPFFRYERYDTQAKTPGAFAKDRANSRVEYTLGATYKPIPQVAVKLDQQWKLNQARTGVNQWNLGLAYIF